MRHSCDARRPLRHASEDSRPTEAPLCRRNSRPGSGLPGGRRAGRHARTQACSSDSSPAGRRQSRGRNDWSLVGAGRQRRPARSGLLWACALQRAHCRRPRAVLRSTAWDVACWLGRITPAIMPAAACRRAGASERSSATWSAGTSRRGFTDCLVPLVLITEASSSPSCTRTP